jgi:Transcription factor TFIIH complex subunit Tfb5
VLFALVWCTNLDCMYVCVSDAALKEYLVYLEEQKTIDMNIVQIDHNHLFVRADENLFDRIQSLVDEWHDENSFQPDPYADDVNARTGAAKKTSKRGRKKSKK